MLVKNEDEFFLLIGLGGYKATKFFALTATHGKQSYGTRND